MKLPSFHSALIFPGVLMLFSMCSWLAPGVQAQIVLSDFETPYVQNFNSMGNPTGGAAASSNLPVHWKVDALGSSTDLRMRTLGTWADAGTVATRNGGGAPPPDDSRPSRSSIFNFGKPTRNGEGSDDRAIGFYGNSSGVHSGNLYAQFKNETGAALNELRLAYDVETFSDGTVAGGTRIALYYSLDGSNWTAAGDDFVTVFSGAESNVGYATTPGSSVTVHHVLNLEVPVADGGLFYLAWNYSNATSSSASSAYALGVDNFSIVAVPEPSIAFLLLPAAGAWLLARRRGRRSA
ncbi:MAG TPA: PEP-CTERM sorting domain-containing protein [Chthoniobacteraceae bacterium]|nr:PEP-CTERM sorting domain-containing protein [Chthoniobacteraceae bacterium]